MNFYPENVRAGVDFDNRGSCLHDEFGVAFPLQRRPQNSRPLKAISAAVNEAGRSGLFKAY